ncbi:MAG: TIGR03862 family flavoprotein [bacterium]|nr:NAD(P)/FAD-dependent oxidoreductase [bacterium]MBU1918224.1 NAD(P)/FAD-dependent oxidoreductase [bacterium]
MSHLKKKIAIIGSGPAGLTCAHILSQNKTCSVSVFDQYKFFGRKVLIAGKTSLNISNTKKQNDFIKHIKGPTKHFENCFSSFFQFEWIDLLNTLDIETFIGTSEQVLINNTASELITNWVAHLKKKDVTFFPEHSWQDFTCDQNKITLSFLGKKSKQFDAVCLALGGQSYLDKPASWVSCLKDKGITFSPFQASNVGYNVSWSQELLQEACGQPLKNIIFKNDKGKKAGDLVITKHGLEGSPVYTLGAMGDAFLDLKPDLSKKALENKLRNNPKKLSPYRLVVKQLNLCPAAKALLFHETNQSTKESLPALIEHIKNFPLILEQPQPLETAIATAGGVCFENLDEALMLKKFPGIFLAGEMLDWDAPTGGFLIQTCASQGAWVGQQITSFINI